MSSRQPLSALKERYAALTRRERLLVALAVVLGPLMIGHGLVVAPQDARLAALETKLATERTTLGQLQAEAANLQQQLSMDPDAGRKAELAALNAERDNLEGQLRQFSSVLVRPDEMNGMLERLLTRHAGLRLIGLKTLAPQSVLPLPAAKEGEAKPAAERGFDLYRHGVEIRLEGSYGQLQAYLAQLEALQPKLLWGKLDYRVIDYPKAELTLTVFTLSPDRTWLAL